MKIRNSGIITIGVTGGIGSGKSEVCNILKESGASIVSADDLAKEIMETNREMKRKLVQAFGESVYLADGKLNRAHLAKIIFFEDTSNRKINAIVHPYVLRRIRQIIQKEKARGQSAILVFEAALIYESGADKMLDVVIVVDANEQGRIQRVMERDRVSREEVLMRIKAQMAPASTVRKADFVIRNDGNLRELESKVKFLFRLFMKMISSTEGGRRS